MTTKRLGHVLLACGVVVVVALVLPIDHGFRRYGKAIFAADTHAKGIRLPIRHDSGCPNILSWVPPGHHPAVVMQAVTGTYVPVEENFIIHMERVSILNRGDLFVMCLDEEAEQKLSRLGVTCAPLEGFEGHRDLWTVRVKVLSCLIEAGHDVLLSDSDALWLKDPLQDIFLSHDTAGSEVISQRGSFPANFGKKWGSTICMGFAFFRARSRGMSTFLDRFHKTVDSAGDDQIAVNRVVSEMGIEWEKQGDYGDMRYSDSTGVGRGVVKGLPDDFTVSLLPHSTYTRRCDKTPISERTVVAHCLSAKVAHTKIDWMKEKGLWLVEDEPVELPSTTGGNVTNSSLVGNFSGDGEKIVRGRRNEGEDDVHPDAQDGLGDGVVHIHVDDRNGTDGR